MKVSMELRGAADVQRVLDEVGPKHAKNLMRSTIHGIAGEVRDQAKANAPTDGNPRTLSKAIKSKRARGTRNTVQSNVVIERSAWFWKFLEFGTQDISERRFIGKASDYVVANIHGLFLTQFGKRLEASVKRALKKQSRN